MHHDCKIHENGVRAVDLEKIPNSICLKSENAIKDSVITFEEFVCKNRTCKYYTMCHPAGVKFGEKYKIVDIVGPIECSEGKDLKEVTI